MEKMIQVTNDMGITFNVRVIEFNEGYGRNDCIIHDRSTPLVEFYDTRYADKFEDFGGRGQFVSRYFLSTLMGTDGWGSGVGGLCLDGGSDSWYVTDENMVEVRNWLKFFE